jgi:N-acetylneuraminic acid mutarotase
VSAAGNIPAGRGAAASWTDRTGNFWLFGGNCYDGGEEDGYLNDLWEFNPATNLWAWMGGSSSLPSDNFGQPGIYGTLGTPAAENIPGGRDQPATWTDQSGNLWLFGGYGFDAIGQVGWLNDLWMFNPTVNQWTWMGGSSVVPIAGGGTAGVYGTLGTPAAGNFPGSHLEASSWTDNKGNLWMFGGEGYDANGTPGYLNDLWAFNPLTNQWAWMGGSNVVGSNDGPPGVYGTLGTPSSGNIPGGRFGAGSWTDQHDKFWLFGGSGMDGDGIEGYLNDLWEFDPSTNEWAWMGGNSVFPVVNSLVRDYWPGNYGTLGVAGTGTNLPGSRDSFERWSDSSGHLWLFSGQGYDANGKLGQLNDLWVYQP